MHAQLVSVTTTQLPPKHPWLYPTETLQQCMYGQLSPSSSHALPSSGRGSGQPVTSQGSHSQTPSSGAPPVQVTHAHRPSGYVQPAVAENGQALPGARASYVAGHAGAFVPQSGFGGVTFQTRFSHDANVVQA